VFHSIRSFSIANVVAVGLALSSLPAVHAKEKSIAGTWTLTVEQRFGLKLELAQKNETVTGTLDWPHGDPIKLTGTFRGGALKLAGDSTGENFGIHVDSTGSLKADGTMTGMIKAHIVDYNDAHEVARTHDQEIPWTAMRGLHGVVHFPR